MIEIPKCRRCSECANSRHHWIECCEAVETGEAGEVIFDRICKHCECLGTECEKCNGEGSDHPEPQGPGICPDCKGEGVIESCMYGLNDQEEEAG